MFIANFDSSILGVKYPLQDFAKAVLHHYTANHRKPFDVADPVCLFGKIQRLFPFLFISATYVKKIVEIRQLQSFTFLPFFEEQFSIHAPLCASLSELSN
jgi:hypothetical protein